MQSTPVNIEKAPYSQKDKIQAVKRSNPIVMAKREKKTW